MAIVAQTRDGRWGFGADEAEVAARKRGDFAHPVDAATEAAKKYDIIVNTAPPMMIKPKARRAAWGRSDTQMSDEGPGSTPPQHGARHMTDTKDTAPKKKTVKDAKTLEPMRDIPPVGESDPEWEKLSPQERARTAIDIVEKQKDEMKNKKATSLKASKRATKKPGPVTVTTGLQQQQNVTTGSDTTTTKENTMNTTKTTSKKTTSKKTASKTPAKKSAPTKASAKKSAPTKSAPPSAATAKRGRSVGHDESAKITWLVKDNPRSKGSETHRRFAKYFGAKTVGDYFAKGGTAGDLRWDIAHKYLSVAH